MHDAAYIPLRARDGSIRAHAIVDPADYEPLMPWRWSVLGKGYVQRGTTIDGKRVVILMHRQLLGLNAGDPREVDHVNGNGFDNRRANLRIATRAQNAQNRRTVWSSTGYRDVFRKPDGRIVVAIKANGKHHHLGKFPTVEAANVAAVAFRAEHMPFTTT